MLGLRTQENNKFINFFNVVQLEAQKLNAYFFVDFGQCDNTYFEDMETDRLFGWLIPKEYIDAFNKDFKNSKVDEKWDKYCSWVTPEVVDNKLIIKFE